MVKISKTLSRNLARCLSRCGDVEYLQDIYFDNSDYLYKCNGLYGKAGGIITNNQVPVAIFNGVDDKLVFNDLSGISIESSLGTSTPTINGNEIEFTSGTCYGLVLSDGTIFNLQEFTGNKVYSIDGSDTGTWTGSGTRYTRVDNIPNLHQANDIKRVLHDNGTAYLPATVSDTEIHVNYTNATIELLSGMHKDDDSRLNLHASEINEPFNYGEELYTNLDNRVDNGWTKNPDGSYSNDGVANGFLNNGSSVFIAGKTFSVICAVTDMTTGNLRIPYNGSNINVDVTNNGFYDVLYTPSVNGFIWAYASNGFDGTMKPESIKQLNTISDRLRELNAPLAYKAGTDQANYNINYTPGKSTQSIKI